MEKNSEIVTYTGRIYQIVNASLVVYKESFTMN